MRKFFVVAIIAGLMSSTAAIAEKWSNKEKKG